MASRRSLSPPARRSLAPFLKRSPSMDPYWGGVLQGTSPRAKPILPYCTSPSQLESIMFDAEDTTDSPFSELMQSQLPANSMSGRTVKQYEEELRVLKKENFNLKLRIYFLEERMQKLGRPLGDGDGAEKKLIELKVQMETLRREMQSKQVLLAQAGKAIEMMEEQHTAEMEKMRKEYESRPVVASHPRPMENSMALYADAFDLPSSFLMPPPPPPGRSSKGEQQDQEFVDSLQQQINELELKLQNVSEELEASQDRERYLNEALESKAPEIQIKIQELCQKDRLLEDQRKIIVEIQIRLDEKQKELESLRNSLESHQTTIINIESDNRVLNEKLQEAEEKRDKSVKVVQNLVSKNKELQSQMQHVEEKMKSLTADQIGEMHQEENEHLWTELECQRRQVERLTLENGDLLREKASAEAKLHEEISELKLQLAREHGGRHSVVPAEIGSTAVMMMGRLDELAAFLATLLKRPHLLTSFSAEHRASLLQLVEQSWGNARQRCTSLSMSGHMDNTAELETTTLSAVAHEESLIGQIQAFLNGPEQEEFLQEVEAHKDKSIDFWPISMTHELDSGKELELARFSLGNSKVQAPPRPPRRHELEEDEEDEEIAGCGATAVEREARGNQSESEAWSEPDRTVSLARMGLPENKTPVNQAVSSPASSELDLTPRTPGKKTSYKKLVHRLHTTEQINEALLAEVGGYKALLKSHNNDIVSSPSNPLQQSFGVSVTTEMLQELEFQRARLEKLLQQNEVMRCQLEYTTGSIIKGDDSSSSLIRRLSEVQEKLQKSEMRVSELEKLLHDTMAHLKATEVQLRERDQLHAQLQQVQQETQEALASMENTKAAMQDEVLQTKHMCQQLEDRAQKATEKCHQLEEASQQDLQRCEMLARQVEEAQQHCLILTQQINQMELTKSVVAASVADHSTAPSSLLHLSDCDDIFNGTAGSVPQHGEDSQRLTLSSPDLGIESDTGRSLEGKEDEKGRLSQENWQLKQKLAESQRIMEKCLEALNKKNRDRQKVQASMEKQLLRTEEVLIKASRNLKLLPSVPKTP